MGLSFLLAKTKSPLSNSIAKIGSTSCSNLISINFLNNALSYIIQLSLDKIAIFPWDKI